MPDFFAPPASRPIIFGPGGLPFSRGLRRALLAATSLFALAAQEALAQNLVIDDTRTISGTTEEIHGGVIVGSVGTGVLTIADQGYVLGFFGQLGVAVGASGAVTVTGAGTFWGSYETLDVGYAGEGTLQVESGGTVHSGVGVIARADASAGSVMVGGAGSTWSTQGSQLIVGRDGDATLLVEAGGAVTSGRGSIAMSAASTSSAQVTGTGSSWSTGGSDLHVGEGGTGTLIIETGGSVSSGLGVIGTNSGAIGSATVSGAGSTWNTGGADLHVGEGGTGTLTVEAGGALTSARGMIGYATGSSGEATVTGAGSTWTAGGVSFLVGRWGNGRLVVADGGVLTSGLGIIGYGDTVSGEASVTGTGSLWSTGTAELYVGYAGTGTLTIDAGGQVSSGSGIIGPQGAGTVTVSGAGSAWSMGTADFYVGQDGPGTLLIAAGGTVTSGRASIGYVAASTGSVRVTGAGSLWDTGSGVLHVGENGNGTLVIEDGGRVTSSVGYIGASATASGTVRVSGVGSSWSTGTADLRVGAGGRGELTIAAGGVVSSGRGMIGYATGSSGEATVTGAGSTWSTGGADFYVGESGNGSLTIESGGTVTTGWGGIGYSAGSTGAATVRGAGSNWTASANIFVGAYGSGTLAIEDGATVTSAGAYIGRYTGSTGGVSLAGSGSAWTVSGGGIVGVYGLGTLDISDGAAVAITEGASIASNAGSEGYVSVNGGSLSVGGYSFVVGLRGDASLSVSNGGSVVSHAAVLAVESGVSADARMSGPASHWAAQGVLLIGSGGRGTLTIEDGARVTVDVWDGFSPADVALYGNGVTWLGEASGSEGTLNLNGSDGARGMLATGQVVKGAGAARLAFDGGILKATTDQTEFLSNFAAGDVVIGAGRAFIDTAGHTVGISTALQGDGALTLQGGGTLILSGTNTYAGGTVVSAATLSVSSDTNLGAASGTVMLNGGTLAATASFESARAMALGASGGTLAVQDAAALILSGTISGTGALTKEGAGTLILTGTNTYTGGTTINAGTLQIGDGGTSGAITGNVVNNASLVFNRSDTYTFPGTITGAGTVTFLGGGTVLFSTPEGYGGAIAVTDTTTLHLEDGALSNSTFRVEDGGLIGGNGTIGGLVVNAGGVAAPGNSPGTLAVNGNVAFNAGSIYRVDVTPDGQHDLITATGSVTISNGASVQVIAQAGAYSPNTRYAIVTGSGSVTGAFGSVASDFAFLAPSLTYDTQNVYLTLVYSAGESGGEADPDTADSGGDKGGDATPAASPRFATYAATANEAGVADAAQALGLGNALFDAIVTLPVSGVPGVFAALSGEAYASVNTVIQQQSVYVREAVGARLRASVSAPGGGGLGYAAQAGAPATASLGGGLTPTLWAQGYGGWGTTYSNGNAASMTNSLGGFLMGADVALAPNARAGLFGGFSQSQFDVDARASSGSMDNYDLGAYAGAQFGALAVRGGASYTWHDVSLARTIAFTGFSAATEGGYTSGTTQVFGEVGYGVLLGAFAFEPFAGLAYANVSGASLTEGGGSAAALSVDLDGMSTLYSTLGVRAATTLDLNGRALTPSLTLGWQHAFGDTTPTATMRFAGGTLPFQVLGVPIAEDALLVQAGVAYALSEAAALAVNYTGQLAGAAAQNAFTAQFALKF